MPSAVETNGAAGPSVARAALRLVQPRLIQPVPITLDRERSLVMDFAAMEAFEGATGLSAWSREAWEGSPKLVVALIWASLLHEEPDLELAAVKRMPCMTLANLSYLTDRLAALWGESMPDADAPATTDAASEAGRGQNPDREGADDPNPRRRAG